MATVALRTILRLPDRTWIFGHGCPRNIEAERKQRTMTDMHDWRSRAGTLFELEKQSASGSRGVVAANNPIGAAADAEMLAMGGNAIGGVRIFPSVAQAIVNVIDHGMTLQEAVEAPRVCTQGQKLEVESTVPDSVRSALSARGHDVREVRIVAGGMNGVTFHPDAGMISGAACWRADDATIALSGGPAR
jgi:gamma-glutamyltranspeptidase/glutathione hydrolase